MIYATKFCDGCTIVFRRNKTISSGIIRVNPITGVPELNGEPVENITKSADWYNIHQPGSNEE